MRAYLTSLKITYGDLTTLIKLLTKHCNMSSTCAVGLFTCPLNHQGSCTEITEEDWLKVLKIEPYL